VPRTIVVLPTYNEAENLPLMVDALMALPLDDLNILVVDDNSPDGTGDIAEGLSSKYPDHIYVLHRQEKNGLGEAYVAGFKHALSLGADYIIQMDCDFSHKPEYVPEMVKMAAQADLVIGSRYRPGGGVDESWSFSRKALSWFANRVYVPVLLGLPVTDATGGFKLWRRGTLIGLDLDRIRSNGYIFQVEMSYVTHQLGFKIREVPIYFPDRVRGQSKMDGGVAMEAALRTWQILFRYHGLKPDMRRTADYSS
jgi:dolichol-phosphate mannosyltransferase